MKHNLALTTILAALLFFTWLYQEKAGENHRVELAHQELIFDPSEQGGLISLSFNNVVLYKRNESFTVGEKAIPANPIRVSEVFQTLSGLAVIRKLSEPEAVTLDMKLAFPEKSLITVNFKTAEGDTPLVIGSRLATNSSRFYASLGKNVMILEDRRPLPMAYQQEDEGELKQKRLETTFSLPEDFFFDTRLFRMPYKISSASFDNPLSRSFAADFMKRKTMPVPMSGLAYDIGEFDAWKDAIELLEAAKLFPSYDPSLLLKLRAQLKLIDMNGEKVELSLFSGYGSLNGDFVISSHSPYLYELGDNHSGIFFQTLQDFWQLQFIPPEGPLELLLSSGEKKYQIKMQPGQVFEVEVPDEKIEPRRDRLAVLYSLLTGRAHYVSDLSDLEITECFALKLKSRNAVFAENKMEWLLIDSVNELAYRYQKRDFPDLPAKLDEYFGMSK